MAIKANKIASSINTYKKGTLNILRSVFPEIVEWEANELYGIGKLVYRIDDSTGNLNVYIANKVTNNDPLTDNGNTWSNVSDNILTTLKSTAFDRLVIYVDYQNSSAEPNGTEEQPYKTVNEVLSTLPKNLNGATVNIIIANGQDSNGYLDSIEIENFSNGVINIQSYTAFKDGTTSSDTYTKYSNNLHIQNFKISNCTASITLNDMTIMGPMQTIEGRDIEPLVYVYNSQNVVINRCYLYGVYTVENISYSIRSNVSNITVNNSLIQDSKMVAVEASNLSKVLLNNVILNNHNTVIKSNSSTVYLANASISGYQVLYVTTYGGRIYDNAQTDAPNY